MTKYSQLPNLNPATTKLNPLNYQPKSLTSAAGNGNLLSSPGSPLDGAGGELNGAGVAGSSGREEEGDSVGPGVIQAREGLSIYLPVANSLNSKPSQLLN